MSSEADDELLLGALRAVCARIDPHPTDLVERIHALIDGRSGNPTRPSIEAPSD